MKCSQNRWILSVCFYIRCTNCKSNGHWTREYAANKHGATSARARRTETSLWCSMHDISHGGQMGSTIRCGENRTSQFSVKWTIFIMMTFENIQGISDIRDNGGNYVEKQFISRTINVTILDVAFQYLILLYLLFGQPKYHFTDLTHQYLIVIISSLEYKQETRINTLHE